MPDETPNAPQPLTFRVCPGTVAGRPILGAPFLGTRDASGAILRAGVRVGEAEAAQLVRCEPGGAPLVPCEASLTLQLQALRHLAGEGLDVEAHLDDLRAVRALRGEPATDIERADLLSYDMVASNLADGQLPDDALAEFAGGPPPVEVDPVLAVIEADTGIGRDKWMRVVDNPSHQVASMRRAARDMLRPVLGNSAQLEDLRLLMIPRQEVERGNAIRRFVEGSEDSRKLEPFRHPHIEDYRTNEPVMADRDGVTVLVYSDFMATYALAWQTDPDHAPKPVAEAEERDPGFPHNLLGR